MPERISTRQPLNRVRIGRAAGDPEPIAVLVGEGDRLASGAAFDDCVALDTDDPLRVDLHAVVIELIWASGVEPSAERGRQHHGVIVVAVCASLRNCECARVPSGALVRVVPVLLARDSISE